MVPVIEAEAYVYVSIGMVVVSGLIFTLFILVRKILDLRKKIYYSMIYNTDKEVQKSYKNSDLIKDPKW